MMEEFLFDIISVLYYLVALLVLILALHSIEIEQRLSLLEDKENIKDLYKVMRYRKLMQIIIIVAFVIILILIYQKLNPYLSLLEKKWVEVYI